MSLTTFQKFISIKKHHPMSFYVLQHILARCLIKKVKAGHAL